MITRLPLHVVKSFLRCDAPHHQHDRARPAEQTGEKEARCRGVDMQ